ncbi:P-loop containing nucleoside triphosphate hydrolase protein [Tribonema minus]|uniref:P-loop containing nucleoside triphosphate hydrolase protein n=1 Tax=Tribonema minus TaxID=303371 RepID=A0A836CKE7_9STRA|nr:P-loop containing nucleoside triphosphate hydrolase protein [Tribonema minus]
MKLNVVFGEERQWDVATPHGANAAQWVLVLQARHAIMAPAATLRLERMAASGSRQQTLGLAKDRTFLLLELWPMVIAELSQVVLGGWLIYKVTQKLQSFDPTAREKATARKAKAMLARRLGKDLENVEFSDYEMLIAQDVVDRSSLDATFSMIGGMGALLDEIRDTVVLPLVKPELFRSNGRSSRLVSAPKGVLFYGSPGTGKTMLAKAIAKESGAAFINLRQSTLQSKWFGESTRMVAAVFSLALKLAPCIIFIDEVDCFLGERGDGEINATLSMKRVGGEINATLSMKTEFMTLWDGMLASPVAQGVMVLAATNRPDALDRAIQRRMSRSFEIGLPDRAARLEILRLLLLGEEVLDATVDLRLLDATVDLRLVAGHRTDGYSGSDLHGVCCTAVMHAVQEAIAAHRRARDPSVEEAIATHRRARDPFVDVLCESPEAGMRRALNMGDFMHALDKVKPTATAAQEYRRRQDRGDAAAASYPAFDASHALAGMMRMLGSMAQPDAAAAAAAARPSDSQLRAAAARYAADAPDAASKSDGAASSVAPLSPLSSDDDDGSAAMMVTPLAVE